MSSAYVPWPAVFVSPQVSETCLLFLRLEVALTHSHTSHGPRNAGAHSLIPFNPTHPPSQAAHLCSSRLLPQAEYSCYYFMQQLPLTRFDGSSTTPPTSSSSPSRPSAIVGSSGPSTLAALAAGGKASQAQGTVTQAVVEMCISSLNRCVHDTQHCHLVCPAPHRKCVRLPALYT